MGLRIAVKFSSLSYAFGVRSQLRTNLRLFFD